MNPFKTFSNTSKPVGDDSAAAFNHLYDIEEDEGSDQGGRTPASSEELQFNQTQNSETDFSADDGFSRGKMSDDLDADCCEIKKMWETHDLKKELENLQKSHEQYKTKVMKMLQEAKERYTSLEQKLIDSEELYERNFSDMKEDLICVQDEIDNRPQETYFHEVLEECHTRLLHMERRRQQQALQMETARPKEDTTTAVLQLMIRVLLVFMSIILKMVSTLSHIVLLLKPSGHMLSALVFAIILHFTWKYWDSISVLKLPEKDECQ